MKFISTRFDIVLPVFLCLMAAAVNAQFTQQGAKLFGTGAGGNAQQGYSVALSSNGNTAAVGGYADNGIKGAIWVYTRTAGVWTAEGAKLTATGGSGGTGLGSSLAISADGNTILAGGSGNALNSGGAWVFTRTAGVWTQQGDKLFGTASGSATQGKSVSLSSDGNTALIGGSTDSSNQGAAWVWTRSNGVWTQQSKLAGAGTVGSSVGFGSAVALSGDGNTAIIGGPSDGSNTGAVWIFTRSGSTWTQQGNKLVGTGNVSLARHGYSVAISSDGNTAIEGAYFDNGLVGAAWVFTRSGGVWSQQGSKLVGTNGSANPTQGWSVALTSDGNTALVGGYMDTAQGAAWVFTRSGTTWTQQSKLVGTGSVNGAGQGWSVALSGDGSTALVGGNSDNGSSGAAWVFTRSITPVFHPAYSIKRVNLENGKELSFTLSSTEHVTLQLFNSQGRMISQVLNETRAAGSYKVSLSKQAHGAYYVDFRAGDFHQTVNVER